VRFRMTTGAFAMAVVFNTLLGVVFAAAPARAAEEKKPAEEAAKPAEGEADAAASAEATAEPAPVAEPAPAPAPAPTPPEPPLFTLYGILKPEVIISQGAETFEKAILLAPTAAANPITDPLYNQGAMSFQLQQSRVGVKIGEGKDLSAKIEIDFIEPTFSASSPIQATRPRLRLAYLTYKMAPVHTIMVGQNWDIFSPLNPFTMNLVGVSYRSGNSAFLRPQIAYTYGSGQGLEISGALGLRNQNTTAVMNAVEYGMFPTFAVQGGYRIGKTWVGASAILGFEETNVAANASQAAFAFNLFASLALSDTFTLNAEAYLGQDTNALGLLTLGTGGTVLDAGGWVSANVKLAKIHSIWATASVAGVLNAADLPVGYTPAVPAVPPAPAVAATRTSTGMESNVSLRATYAISPTDGLQFYAEPFLFITKHKLLDADDPTRTLASRVGWGTQLGARYNF
jgi:hypothetical protein